MAGEDDFGSERDFMDGLRVLKVRSGLSYREIAARMSCTDPGRAMARSTLANLLAGNSLPRRPGQVAALVEVLAADLNEPGQTQRYLQAWSRLVAARSEPEPPATPAPARSAPLVPRAPAARPATSGQLPRPHPPAATAPDENPLSGRHLRPLVPWLILLTVIAYVLWAMLPPGVVPFWMMWLIFVWPLPLAGLINWLGRAGDRHRADLGDVPADYLRMEYRGIRRAA